MRETFVISTGCLLCVFAMFVAWVVPSAGYVPCEVQAQQPKPKAPVLLSNRIPVRIIAPERIDTGAPFMVQLRFPEKTKATDIGDNYKWSFSPEPEIYPLELTTRSGDPVLWFQGIEADTTIGVLVQIPKDGLDPIGYDTVLVKTGKGPKPPPDPDDPDDPDPPDPDDPVTPSMLFVIIVEETGEAVAARGAMIADKRIGARFKEKGHKWRIVDKDVVGPDGKPPADVKPFLDRAKGKKRPRIFLVTPEGKLRYEGDAPMTVDAMLTLLTKNGG